MYGSSPEERKRAQKQRQRLQRSLEGQVKSKKKEATLKEIEELRLLLKSRQSKLDKGVDHWGRSIPPNDPFGVRRQMVTDQENILRKISEKEDQVKNYEVRGGEFDTLPKYERDGKDQAFFRGYNDTHAQQQVDFDEDLNRMVSSMNTVKTSSQSPSFDMTPQGRALALSPSRDPVSFNDAKYVPKSEPDRSPVINRVDTLESKLQEAIQRAMMTETAMRHLFVQFDKIGSGRISRADFRRGFGKLALDATEDEIDALVRRLDNNGDGYIDYLEFFRIAVRGSNIRRRREQQSSMKKKEKHKDKSMNEPHPRGSMGGGGSRRQQTEAQKAARRGLAAREERKVKRENAEKRRRRRRQKREDKVQIDELFTLCKQLLREQENLRKSIAKTRNQVGVPDSDSSDYSAYDYM